MKLVTDEQIIEAIIELSNEYCPTILEIAEYVGLKSKSNMHRRLKRLERLGYVKNTTVRRGISLTENGRRLIS